MNTYLVYKTADGEKHFLVCDPSMRMKPIPDTNRGIIYYYNMQGVEIEIVEMKRI